MVTDGGIQLSEPPCLEVVGTDASGIAGLSPSLQAKLRRADLVAAPQRLIPDLSQWLLQRATVAPNGDGTQSAGPELLASDRPSELMLRLSQGLAFRQRMVLLASGDPLWFGIGRLLLQHFSVSDLRFHPAPSSMQLAFASIGRPWQDAAWVSLHGRDPEPLAALLQQRPPALAVLTDPAQGGADQVRRILHASGLEGAYRFWLCERLGHPQSRVRSLDPTESLPPDLDPLHLVLLIAEPPSPNLRAEAPLFGIDDGLWLQHVDHPGLMTKREVRIQLLADLELPARGVIWDLGAGVGSIGLEALRLRPELELWAVERRIGAASLIRANADWLGVRPAGVVEGVAPGALAELPDPDRVLLGGGGRGRLTLLEAVLQRLRPGGLVVVPLATIEALAELRTPMEAAGLRVSVTQHQVWRGAPLGDGTRLAPLNPVLVLKGQWAGG